MAFTFSAAGLDTGRFPEARALVVQKWKARFGEDVLTASDTPDGLIIDVIALMLALAWEGVGDVYANSFFRTAVGQSLDWILDLFGRPRLPASPSTAVAFFYGDASTTVPVDSVAGVASTLVRFDTDTPTTTSANASTAPIVVRILAVTPGNDYVVSDGAFNYGVTATGSDTPQTIAEGIRDLMNASSYATFAPGLDPDGNAILVILTGITTLILVSGSTDTDEIDIRFGAAVNMTALENGALQATAGQLNRVESSIPNIDGVINVTDATIGRDLETDPDYRSRHLDRINSTGGATAQSIRANVLDATDPSDEAFEIEYCRVFNNPTPDVDARGVPGNSFETVWIGPAGTAAEDIVAAAIFEKAPVGIDSFGSIDTDIVDEAGDTVTISHSRGTELYLHINIVVTPGEGYPTVGDPLEAIRLAVAEHFDRGGDGELGLGDDFYIIQIVGPMNDAVPGIAGAVLSADATVNPGDTPSFAVANISVDPDTILRVDSSRVTVT